MKCIRLVAMMMLVLFSISCAKKIPVQISFFSEGYMLTEIYLFPTTDSELGTNLLATPLQSGSSTQVEVSEGAYLLHAVDNEGTEYDSQQLAIAGDVFYIQVTDEMLPDDIAQRRHLLSDPGCRDICQSNMRSIATAEAMYWSLSGSYGSLQSMIDASIIGNEASDWLCPAGDGASYVITASASSYSIICPCSNLSNHGSVEDGVVSWQ